MSDEHAVGYNPDTSPNEHWQRDGLACEYEHCIETMPLQNPAGKASCPVFGHDCPGGVERAGHCHGDADRLRDAVVPRIADETDGR